MGHWTAGLFVSRWCELWGICLHCKVYFSLHYYKVFNVNVILGCEKNVGLSLKAAEMEAKNMKMTSEVLQTCQQVHLCVYLATSMLKDVITEVRQTWMKSFNRIWQKENIKTLMYFMGFLTAIGEREELEIETNTCMA